jgi:hypothetical protein
MERSALPLQETLIKMHDQMRIFELLLCVAPVEILEIFFFITLQVMLPHLSIAQSFFPR